MKTHSQIVIVWVIVTYYAAIWSQTTIRLVLGWLTERALALRYDPLGNEARGGPCPAAPLAMPKEWSSVTEMHARSAGPIAEDRIAQLERDIIGGSRKLVFIPNLPGNWPWPFWLAQLDVGGCNSMYFSATKWNQLSKKTNVKVSAAYEQQGPLQFGAVWRQLYKGLSVLLYSGKVNKPPGRETYNKTKKIDTWLCLQNAAASGNRRRCND